MFVNRISAASIGRKIDLGNPDIVHKPFDIDSASPGPSHVTITYKIIEAIGIEGTGDDSMIHIGRRFGCDQICDVFRFYSCAVEDRCNFSGRILDHLCCEGFMLTDLSFRRVSTACRSESFSRFFKRMTEGTMSDIMQKGSKQSDLRTSFIKFAFDALQINFTSDNLYKSTRIVKYTNRMSETRMAGGRKHKLGHSELFDATKPLHIRGLE